MSIWRGQITSYTALTTLYSEDGLAHTDGFPGALVSTFSSNTRSITAFSLDIPGAYHTIPHRLTWLWNLLCKIPSAPDLVLATPFCPNNTACHHLILQHLSLSDAPCLLLLTCLTLLDWKLYEADPSFISFSTMILKLSRMLSVLKAWFFFDWIKCCLQRWTMFS